MVAQRVAFDLSGDTIRVVAGSAGGPMQAAEAAAPPDAISAGAVRNGAALAPILRQLLAKVESKENKVMIAASDSLASFRVLSFPKDTTEPTIDSVVRTQLPADLDRMALQRQDVTATGSERTVYAVVFDRLKVNGLAAMVRMAGLEPVAVELKSLCVARIAPAPSCIVLDLTVEPCEAFLVDRSLPRLWHTFKADFNDQAELGRQLAGGLGAVLAFYKRTPAGSDFPAEAPVFVSSDRELSPTTAARVQARVGHRLEALPALSRVAPGIPQSSYLACLGLIMRRR